MSRKPLEELQPWERVAETFASYVTWRSYKRALAGPVEAKRVCDRVVQLGSNVTLRLGLRSPRIVPDRSGG